MWKQPFCYKNAGGWNMGLPYREFVEGQVCSSKLKIKEKLKRLEQTLAIGYQRFTQLLNIGWWHLLTAVYKHWTRCKPSIWWTFGGTCMGAASHSSWIWWSEILGQFMESLLSLFKCWCGETLLARPRTSTVDTLIITGAWYELDKNMHSYYWYVRS